MSGKRITKIVARLLIVILFLLFEWIMIRIAGSMVVQTYEDVILATYVTSRWEAMLGWSMLWTIWLLWELPILAGIATLIQGRCSLYNLPFFRRLT